MTGQLTSDGLQDGNPVWSPDGKQIAFYHATGDCRLRGVGYELWVIDSDGAGLDPLMPGRLGRNLDPSWR